MVNKKTVKLDTELAQNWQDIFIANIEQHIIFLLVETDSDHIFVLLGFRKMS